MVQFDEKKQTRLHKSELVFDHTNNEGSLLLDVFSIHIVDHHSKISMTFGNDL